MEKQFTDTVNVSEIMEHIRTEIQEKGYSSDMLSFSDVPLETEGDDPTDTFDMDALQNSLQYYNNHHTVPLERPLKGNPFTVLLKKIMRHFLRFYAEPYAAEQNSLNACTAQAQAQIGLYIQESRMHSTKALLERIEVLELQQKNTHLEIEQLQAQIRLLQKKCGEEA